jgi:hypothetical protein
MTRATKILEEGRMNSVASSGATARAISTRRRSLFAASLVAGLLGLLGVAPLALAGIQREFAIFSDCPLNNPEVGTCIVSTTTSGEFKIGKKTVPITQPVVLQGGLTPDSSRLVPAADGNTLSKTALPVPGGIIGIELLGPLTSVTATAELAGTAEVNVVNANTAEGVAASLPLKVKLDNPALGSTCYVGSNSEPLAPQLTTGTTNPPPPNTPISGDPGEAVLGGHGKIITILHSSLVDNAFAAPGAKGCAEPLSLLVDPAVDLQTGLPAPSGENAAVLNGTLVAAGARYVKAQALLPTLGRCQKVESEKVGKEKVFHGGYVDAGCTEENPARFGKFEWTPGPGAANKFSGTSTTATLETTGKSQIRCAASTTHGEYTGTKSATLGLALTGCKLVASGESCQSSGAASGEITASGLSAELGFIQDIDQGGEVLATAGWDLKREPSIISGECGSAKQALLVTGSVIAPISAAEKMVSAYTLKLAETGGKQAPESFEEAPKDTLTETLGGGPSEQAGLKATEKITNEEKLEFKVEAE